MHVSFVDWGCRGRRIQTPSEPSVISDELPVFKLAIDICAKRVLDWYLLLTSKSSNAVTTSMLARLTRGGSSLLFLC